MKLVNYIEFKNGKKKPNENGNIPIYGGNGILGYTNKSNTKKNNLVIGRVGAYCGCVYKSDEECWISDNAILGIVRHNVDYNFMYYLLKSLCLNNHHIGSSQPLMTQEILNNLEVDIPNYDIQVKIGKILLKFDKKIELNNQMNNNIFEIGISLVNKYFNGMQESILLQNVIKFFKGKKPNDISNTKKSNYERYLTIACLNNQELNYADTNKMIFAKKDLLMVMDGASSGDIYYSDYGIVGSTLAKVDITDKKFYKESIFFCLKKYKDLIRSKNTGSAIPHTDKAFVCSLEIPKIGISKQQKFITLLSKIQENQKENQILGQLRDTLLPKLMKGAINLDKIEI